MTGKRWAYEDFEIGASIALGQKHVTAQEIVEFASEFDPQPMHLDEAAGVASLLGGLGASGWHTCAMFMRMMCDAFLLDSTSQGAPGIDKVRWRKPVLAGDTLTGRSTVLSKRLSQSRPTLGFVACRHELFNQNGETVFELENTAMFSTRSFCMTLDEYLEVGETVTLGTHHFDAASIKAFAAKYDPQRFHMDEREAQHSVFGKLCASGWHTCAAWMKCNVATPIGLRGRTWDGPGPEPVMGPSPGFQNLKWLKPVFAGETVTFTRLVHGHEAIPSRPGWRRVSLSSEGFDTTRAKVIEFESAVLMKAG